MNESDIQLLIIPGIGEDERMSYAQLGLPYRLLRPRYIAPHDSETFEHYCIRFAHDLRSRVDTTLPLFLMGCSLGGAVVQELSRHLRSVGVILISTYRSSVELRPLYRIFGRHLAMRIPILIYQFGAAFANAVIAYLTCAPEHDTRLCAKMYRQFPKVWFRQLARMGAEWKGCRVTAPVLRIHGTRDPIVPYRGQKDISVLIQDDKHMCNLSEKETVNEEIVKFISATVRSQR